MSTRHKKVSPAVKSITALIALVLVLPAPPVNASPIRSSDLDERCEQSTQQAPGDPARDIADYCRSTGRLMDQLGHPEFQARTSLEIPRYWPEHLLDLTGGYRSEYHHTPGPEVSDPYRLDWNWEEVGRGTSTAVEFENTHGAILRGTLWLPPGTEPVPNGSTPDPYPAIIVTPGGASFEEMYRWAAQGLAEAGYAVLTFDPQGHGSSDRCGPPTPTDDCPGEPGTLGYTESGAEQHLTGLRSALDWLLEGPFRGYVDPARVGLAGHSLGAWATLIVGHRDPRVDAVVAWDGYGPLPQDLRLTVPTMLQGSEIRHICPFTRSLNCRSVIGPAVGGTGAALPGNEGSDDHPVVVTAERLRAEHVPMAEIILRGSTHYEWAYVYGPAGYPASSKGERVAMYYTLAWFDRWVREAPGRNGVARGNRSPGVLDPQARLTAKTFDGSADASTIGTGYWHPVLGNVPYTIEGESVADHLSDFYRSQYDLGPEECLDMRSGC